MSDSSEIKTKSNSSELTAETAASTITNTSTTAGTSVIKKSLSATACSFVPAGAAAFKAPNGGPLKPTAPVFVPEAPAAQQFAQQPLYGHPSQQHTQLSADPSHPANAYHQQASPAPYYTPPNQAAHNAHAPAPVHSPSSAPGSAPAPSRTPEKHSDADQEDGQEVLIKFGAVTPVLVRLDSKSGLRPSLAVPAPVPAQTPAAATLQAATEDDEEDWENVSDKISARLLVKEQEEEDLVDVASDNRREKADPKPVPTPAPTHSDEVFVLPTGPAARSQTPGSPPIEFEGEYEPASLGTSASTSPRSSVDQSQTGVIGDRFGSLSMDENSYRSTPSSASIPYNNSGNSNTNFRDSRNNNSNSNSSSNNTSEWKKSASQNTSSRDMYSSRDHAPHSNNSNSSNSNLKAEGWRGSSSNLASDVSNQSSVSGSVLAARTAIDKVLRYDKSTFLAVYGTVKKLPEYQEAPGILKGQYPAHARTDRTPFGLKAGARLTMSGGGGGGGGGGGSNGGNNYDNNGNGQRDGPNRNNNNNNNNNNRNKGGKRQQDEEPHPDEELMFGKDALNKEGAFKYQPSRLEDTTDPEVIISKAKLILNKLSVTNFDKLSDQFMTVGVDSVELMGRAIDLIVLCAQMNEHFSFMYAELCKKITDKWSSGTADEDEDSLGKTFRVNLLNRCHEEFSIDRAAAIDAIRKMDIPTDEKDEKEIILKKSYTGHMRFLGEIYMYGLVKMKVMKFCILELINSEEEESLVCLCKLMSTIGDKFEEENKRKKTKTSVLKNMFGLIAAAAANHPSSRIRYMLKDLLDLRKSGWVARRETERAQKLGVFAEEEKNGGKAGKPKAAVIVSPAAEKAPDDEWNTITKKKGGSSSNLASSVSSSSLSNSNKPLPDSSTKNAPVRGGGGGFSALAVKDKKKSSKDKDKDKDKEPKDKDKEKDKDGKKSSIKSSKSKDDIASSVTSATTTKKKSSSDKGEDAGSLLPGHDGEPLDRGVIRRVKAAVEEYYLNSLEIECIEVTRELVHPNGMGEVLKSCLNLAFDKKSDARAKTCVLLKAMHKDGLLSTPQAEAGWLSYLHDLDEIIIDVPLAGAYASQLFADFIVNKILSLKLLHNIRDENNFSFSSRYAEFVGQVLKAVTELNGGDLAATQALLTESEIELTGKIIPGPKQGDADALTEFKTKYNLPFLL